MSTSVADIRGQNLGRYHVIDRLGSGGMAEVWLAQQTGTSGFRKLVVIKTLHPHLAESPDVVDMFIREASVAVALSHPNVVQILDLGFDAGRHYMVMEYIAGTNMRRLAKKLRKSQARLPLWALLDIASRVCDGLQHIHDHHAADGTELNLVHRDLTPDNIMLSFTGNVKIVDFGVMRIRGVDQTGMGRIVGKPHYMAPEQIRDESVDRRADIYSLGVLMYQYLAGRRPFSGNQQAAVMLSVVTDKPAPVQQYNPSISPKLAAIVMKAMAFHPQDRHQHAQALADDLLSVMHEKGLARNRRRMAMFVASCFHDSMQIPKQTLNLLKAAKITSPGAVPSPKLPVSGGSDVEIEIEVEEPHVSTQQLSDGEIDRLISELDHTPSSLLSGPEFPSVYPPVVGDKTVPPALPEGTKKTSAKTPNGPPTGTRPAVPPALPKRSKAAGKPAAAKASSAKAATAKPATAKPATARPATAKSSTPKPAKETAKVKAAKPATRPAVGKASTAKPAAAQASTAKSAVLKPQTDKLLKGGRPKIGRRKAAAKSGVEAASSTPKESAAEQPVSPVAPPSRASAKSAQANDEGARSPAETNNQAFGQAAARRVAAHQDHKSAPGAFRARASDPSAAPGGFGNASFNSRTGAEAEAPTPTEAVSLDAAPGASGAGFARRESGDHGPTLFRGRSKADSERGDDSRDRQGSFDSMRAREEEAARPVEARQGAWRPAPGGLAASLASHGSFGDLVVDSGGEAPTTQSSDSEAKGHASGGSHRAAALFDEGHALLMEGDLERARFKWEAACEEAPDNRTYSANLRRLKQMIEKDSS